MDSESDLVRAIVPEFCQSAADAAVIIAGARRLEVDVIDYCGHRFGLDRDTVEKRAAAWAGLAFSSIIPQTGTGDPQVRRLDNLGRVRSIRTKLFDRDIYYVAPSFSQLLNLRAHLARQPEMRRKTCLVPQHAIRTALVRLCEPLLMDEARQRLSRSWPFASAHLDVGRGARAMFALVLAGLSLMTLVGPLMAQAVLLPLVGLILMAPALFRLLAIVPMSAGTVRDAPALADADLPTYSILIPLCDEAEMVPLLDRAMRSLDYPPEKLDIKFVVEARCDTTIAAIKALPGNGRFELVVVPDAPPFTKPKALDFALPLVSGSCVVVYDADDIPNPDQLRLAAAAFAHDADIDCLQAELLMDNARETPLTGLFAGEYAGQFGMVMPALVRWGLPVPLGGTSNHFRTEVLRSLGGWDAFNVTEDADLGVRLARRRLRTKMLYSQTFEEAPITLKAWLQQRTRWMKGWMQTLIVHNSRPVDLWRDLGWKGFLAFNLYVGSMVLSPLLHTLFIVGLGLGVASGYNPLAGLGQFRTTVAVAVFVVGYGSSFTLALAGLLRLGQKRLLLQQVLLPLYWVLHATATVSAAYQLVTRPHFWAKTRHGVTRLERRFPGGEDGPPDQGSPTIQ